MPLWENGLAKIREGKYYQLRSGPLVKVVRILEDQNKVIYYRFDVFENEALDLTLAPQILNPMFRIGEVARIVRRSRETIRKYEWEGKIAKATKYVLDPNGNSTARFYTTPEVYEIMDFFAGQRPVGRPPKKDGIVGGGKKNAEAQLKKLIDARYQQVKNMEL